MLPFTAGLAAYGTAGRNPTAYSMGVVPSIAESHGACLLRGGQTVGLPLKLAPKYLARARPEGYNRYLVRHALREGQYFQAAARPAA